MSYELTQKDIPKLINIINSGPYPLNPKPYDQLDGLGKYAIKNVDELIYNENFEAQSIDLTRFAFCYYAKYKSRAACRG